MPVISVLSPSSKVTVHHLLCKAETGPCKNDLLLPGMNLSFVSRKHWVGMKGDEFSFLVQERPIRFPQHRHLLQDQVLSAGEVSRAPAFSRAVSFSIIFLMQVAALTPSVHSALWSALPRDNQLPRNQIPQVVSWYLQCTASPGPERAYFQ